MTTVDAAAARVLEAVASFALTSGSTAPVSVGARARAGRPALALPLGAAARRRRGGHGLAP